VGGNEAVVRISKASACSHDCSQCGGCSNPTYNMTVCNPVGAKLGDRVQIEASSSKVHVMAFLLYIVPVLFLIAAGRSNAIYDHYHAGRLEQAKKEMQLVKILIGVGLAVVALSVVLIVVCSMLSVKN